jgi:hypothetical protein
MSGKDEFWLRVGWHQPAVLVVRIIASILWVVGVAMITYGVFIGGIAWPAVYGFGICVITIPVMALGAYIHERVEDRAWDSSNRAVEQSRAEAHSLAADNEAAQADGRRHHE